MATPSRPGSSLSNASSASEKEDMWSSMLSSVASSKRLPQKNLLVLGGTPEAQREFIESLHPSKKTAKPTPLANAFALGYTYLDVLDADHEDVLARMGVYLISEPTPAFIPLLRPLFTPASLPETLVVILLDWSRPWEWMGELKTWIRLLRGIFTDLDDDCRRTLDDVMNAWESRRNVSSDPAAAGAASIDNITIPLGPGEFDEPIGLPLCVVCQNADKIEVLERERGWKEEEFDFILQFLRTILLKHGASLIYTTPSLPSPLPALLYNMLSLSPLLRAPPLKHNIIERDKILVPAFWDSWGKIRVLREGFDVEGITAGWSADITPSESDSPTTDDGGAQAVYEEVIINHTRRNSTTPAPPSAHTLEVQPVDTQTYLAQQLLILEARAEEEKASRGAQANKDDARKLKEQEEGAERIVQQVGPVQFNVGGIQVDAENMLERLKEREVARAEMPEGIAEKAVDGKSQEDVLSAFFSSLMKKDKGAAGKGGRPPA